METLNAWLVPSLIVLAVLYLVLGLDELFVDYVFFRNKLCPRELSPRDKKHLSELQEKQIAILIPAWKESNIISQMLRGNLEKISYSNYHIFVGCYPNDLDTFRKVSKIENQTGRVTALLNPLPGPTSKGQLLNWLLQEITNNPNFLFDVFLFHDAEDIIHPLSLQLINLEVEDSDFVQIPVFSLPVRGLFNVGSTYMDEFAETHTRDLLVRRFLGVSIPSAGVGFALSRRAIEQLMVSTHREPFNSQCLTEDYVLGIRTFQEGFKQSFPCCFQKREDGTFDWISTFEYFPKRILRSIRQKARWTQGIALQSPKHLGWFGTYLNCFFLFRDRKSLLANIFGLMGLSLLPLTIFTALEDPFLAWLSGLNLIFLINRVFQRGRALKRVYSDATGFEVVFRYPLSIIVNGLAALLAIRNFSKTLFLKAPTVWVKTEHELPEGFGQTAARGI
jgi:adsorption protein B